MGGCGRGRFRGGIGVEIVRGVGGFPGWMLFGMILEGRVSGGWVF